MNQYFAESLPDGNFVVVIGGKDVVVSWTQLTHFNAFAKAVKNQIDSLADQQLWDRMLYLLGFRIVYRRPGPNAEGLRVAA